MCGRFNLRTTPLELAQCFQLLEVPPEFPARFNIAPTQSVMAVRLETGIREVSLFRWGLIPAWAKDKKGPPLINARLETLAEKPAFRNALKRRRCLIAASGFYEWQTTANGDKQPYHIFSPSHPLLAFAGLWEHWEQAGETVESCTIVTTAANVFMQTLHDRMPVILPSDLWPLWLDGDTPSETAWQMLQDIPETPLTANPLSKAVNNVRNDSPACLEPA